MEKVIHNLTRVEQLAGMLTESADVFELVPASMLPILDQIQKRLDVALLEVHRMMKEGAQNV